MDNMFNVRALFSVFFVFSVIYCKPSPSLYRVKENDKLAPKAFLGPPGFAADPEPGPVTEHPPGQPNSLSLEDSKAKLKLKQQPRPLENNKKSGILLDESNNIPQNVDLKAISRTIPVKYVSMDTVKATFHTANSYNDVLRMFLNVPSWSDRRLEEYLHRKENGINQFPAPSYTHTNEVMHADSRRPMKGLSRKDVEDMYQHVLEEEASIKEHACGQPVAQIVHVNKERIKHAYKRYLPDCAMVYRCHHKAGCCSDKQKECGPIEKENIYKYFMVLTVNPNDKEPSYAHDPGDFRKLSFVNHTKCGCIPARNKLMNCKCPAPFKRVPEFPTQCKCDCLKKKGRCDMIKHGKQYLSKSSIMCVKKGHCKVPPCYHGQFRAKDAICPPEVQTLTIFASGDGIDLKGQKKSDDKADEQLVTVSSPQIRSTKKTEDTMVVDNSSHFHQGIIYGFKKPFKKKENDKLKIDTYVFRPDKVYKSDIKTKTTKRPLDASQKAASKDNIWGPIHLHGQAP